MNPATRATEAHAAGADNATSNGVPMPGPRPIVPRADVVAAVIPEPADLERRAPDFFA